MGYSPQDEDERKEEEKRQKAEDKEEEEKKAEHKDNKEKEEPLDPCIIEKGKDYQTDKALFAMEHIVSLKICRQKCQRESRCGAWTWGSTRNTWGLTNMCFLKELGMEQRPHREDNAKVTSGLPCRKEKKKTEEDDDDEE